MEGETGIINAEHQQPIDRFNDRIDQLINKRPFQSTTDQIIIRDLSASSILPAEANSVSLWGIARVIQDKYKDGLAAERIIEHGILIQETAIYIAQRVSDGTIDKTRAKIARTLSQQLFNYGENLVGEKPDKTPISIDKIAKDVELNDQQTQAVEHLLTIDKLSQLSNNSKGLILNQFFYDVGAISPPEVLKVQTDQITEALEMAITMPVRELENSIIRRKMESLSKETPLDSLDFSKLILIIANLSGKDISGIHQALELSADKQKLESNRNDPSKTIDDISNLEWQIAQKIQIATSSIVLQEKITDHGFVHRPDKKFYNVSATTLGANLMLQTGIDCLIGNTPDSSALFLMTTNGGVILMDMTQPINTYDITNNVQETTLFNQLPGPEGLRINNPIPKEKESHFTLYNPEDGQRILTLFNMAIAYRDTPPIRGDRDHDMDKFDNYQRSIKTFEKITNSNLQDEDIWYNYGKTLMMYATDDNLSQILSKEDKITSLQQAIEAWQKVIKLNRNNHEALKQIRQAERKQKSAA